MVGQQPGFRWKPLVEETNAASLEGIPLRRRQGRGVFEGTQFIEVMAKKVINKVPSASKMAFRYSLNPYRGCMHGCQYCYARPHHAWLGLDAARDFERVIVVKLNAAERAKLELAAPTWRGEPVVIGTSTDPYQQAEGRYHITRRVLEVFVQAANPFSLVTKSTLVLADQDLLAEASARSHIEVWVSISTLDADLARALEPKAPPPAKRLDALARLAQAGIPCGLLAAPILPGMGDDEGSLRRLAKAARAAGARWIQPSSLHLRPAVAEHFMAWLARTHPELVSLYRARFASGPYEHPAQRRRLAGLFDACQPAPRPTRPTKRPSQLFLFRP